MKSNLTTAALLVGIWFTYACSSGSDSTDKAQKANEERIDKQAVAASNEDKATAKNVAKSMVELADAQQAIVQMSQIALNKAQNGQVKAYAQQMLTAGTANNQKIQAYARQSNVTLPADLSSTNKNHLSKLNDMRSSTEFDTQYLDYLADLHSDLLDAAAALRDDAPNDEIKTFTRKLVDDNRDQKKLAKQLKDVLQ